MRHGTTATGAGTGAGAELNSNDSTKGAGMLIRRAIESLTSFRPDSRGRLRRVFIPSGITFKPARRALRAGDLAGARAIMMETLSILRRLDSTKGS